MAYSKVGPGAKELNKRSFVPVSRDDSSKDKPIDYE